MDGILGMALSSYTPGKDRFLYFHALAATTENVVRTKVLRNDSFIYDSNANPHSINVSIQTAIILESCKVPFKIKIRKI